MAKKPLTHRIRCWLLRVIAGDWQVAINLELPELSVERDGLVAGCKFRPAQKERAHG